VTILLCSSRQKSLKLIKEPVKLVSKTCLFYGPNPSILVLFPMVSIRYVLLQEATLNVIKMNTMPRFISEIIYFALQFVFVFDHTQISNVNP
jgi:hypothetical protein